MLGAPNPKSMPSESKKFLFLYLLSKVTFWPVKS